MEHVPTNLYCSVDSHGAPGIFVKYDLFSFKVCVNEGHKTVFTVLRFCGIVVSDKIFYSLIVTGTITVNVIRETSGYVGVSVLC